MPATTTAFGTDVERVLTPGGLEAWLVNAPSVPLLAVAFSFRGGAAADPAGSEGLSRMVAGLLEPTEGSVEIAGFELADVEARATTSFLPDDPVLYDDLSLREHVTYISRLHGGDGWDDYAESLCERLGLEERIDDLPARFSRGLRQKTAIVLALVRPFSLLLVDEPFVGLDQPGKIVLLELLDEVHGDGAATLVATHDPAYVDRVERSIALRDGEVIFDGDATAEQVLALVGG